MDFHFCQFLKRRAPINDDGIFKIMDMRPISIKKHEWIFADTGRSKKISLSQGIHEKNLKLWILDISWKSENQKRTLRSPKYEHISNVPLNQTYS